jgi:uncharacterized membrane protein
MEDNQIDTQVDNTNQQQSGEAHGSDNSKLMAIVAYFIFFLPLLTEYKDNDFVKYHVKQGIMVLLVGIGIGVVSSIPFLGWVIAPLAMMALLVLWVMGILNASQGQKKPLPLVGKYAEELLKF